MTRYRTIGADDPAAASCWALLTPEEQAKAALDLALYGNAYIRGVLITKDGAVVRRDEA